jgi:hypothetical protein
METHLVIDLSGHGYGHAGMTVPVLNALRRYGLPSELTIRTTVPIRWLAANLEGPFNYVSQSDFGMVMSDAMRVLPEESARAYASVHADWERHATDAAGRLAVLKPTLLLSNISYLSLEAARQAGVPAIAFSSLNWADVFHHYCIRCPGADLIWRQMVDAYAAAESFIQPTPSMDMPYVRNGVKVGPIAGIGRDRKRELRCSLGLGPEATIVLVALGGIPTRLSVDSWPRLHGYRVLLASNLNVNVNHPDVTPVRSLGFPFVDLVRSSDVLITKPGYGLVTESACNGTPVLIVPRDDWPEAADLIEWLRRHNRMSVMDEGTLRSGNFAADVTAILSAAAPVAPQPTGVEETAALLAARLGCAQQPIRSNCSRNSEARAYNFANRS